MKKALAQVQRIFVDLEKFHYIAKLKKGRELTKAKTGRCEGRKPFGENPKLPAESQILISILDENIAGATPKVIADTLNSRGLPTRSGKPWQGSVVAKILRRRTCKTGSDTLNRSNLRTTP